MKPNSSPSPSASQRNDDSHSSGRETLGMLSSTKRFAAAGTCFCTTGAEPVSALPSVAAVRKANSNGCGFDDGPSSNPIKAVEPGANTLDAGTRCTICRLAHSPRVPPPMRRPGKESRGAACTISEHKAPMQSRLSSVEARTFWETKRAIEGLAIAEGLNSSSLNTQAKEGLDPGHNVL